MTIQNRGIPLFHIVARRIALFAILSAHQFIVVPNASAWELSGGEWYGATVKGNAGSFGDSFTSGAGDAASFAGTQNVFFDFDTGTSGAEHVYTVPERDAIVAGVAAIYAPWDFTFSHTVVPSGTFATLFFNSGTSGGGQASDIDFRNLSLGGSAVIDVNPLLPVSPPSADVVGLSITVGAHELGHLVGLRHADSLGRIGNGLSTGPPPGAYLPPYPGPTSATETPRHTMASPASVGQPLSQAIAGTYVGERSAVKLEFNEVGTVSPETGLVHNTPLTAQPLILPTFPVPNTAIPGDSNYNKLLFADAEVVTGSIAVSSQLDYYQFSGTAGDMINAEVLSKVPNRFGTNDIDPMISLFRPDGVTLVMQGGGVAFNDDEFESQDAALIDVVLPVTGTYYVQITPFSAGDLGDYELYLYRFRSVAIPEPAAFTSLFFGSLLAAGTIRRARLP